MHYVIELTEADIIGEMVVQQAPESLSVRDWAPSTDFLS